MSDDQEAKLNRVLERCERLSAVIKDPRRAPGSFAFLNRIVEIESIAETNVELADHLLTGLTRELKEADDGMGGTILSASRYQRFFPGQV